MIKVGDKLEWMTIHGVCRGTVVESENGQLVCKVGEVAVFPLKDLRYSSSIKIIEI